MGVKGIGAACFGLVIGWLTYFTMRHKKEHAISDIATVIGAVGGAAVVSLFPTGEGLFSSYAIGLAIGFFAYFLIFMILVAIDSDVSIKDVLIGKKGEGGGGPALPPILGD